MSTDLETTDRVAVLGAGSMGHGIAEAVAMAGYEVTMRDIVQELVFRGERIDAERAEEWGLVNRSVDGDEFEGTVEAFVEDLVNGPPIALRKAKEVMNEGADGSIEAGLRMESQAFGLLLTTDDMTEGASTSMEDREPEFEGH